MNWLFYLDDIEIEEPVGFDALELSMKRHDQYHGMVYQASLTSLEFYGEAYTYLKNKKKSEGIKANVSFRALATCQNYDYQEVLSGRLNFGKYNETFGSNCSIQLPWEEQSCEIVLKARMDQKVDIDKATGVDGITSLANYNGLAQEKELPAHNLQASVEGYVYDEGDAVSLDIFPSPTNSIYVRPTYGRPIYESINQSQLFPSVFAASFNGVSDSALSPILLLDEVVGCFSGLFPYEVRLKGSYDYEYAPGGTIDDVRLIVATGNPFFQGAVEGTDYEIIHQDALSHGARTAVGTFDYTYSGTTTLNQEDGFYVYFQSIVTGIPFLMSGGTVTFDKETYVNISAVKSCPATEAELYLVHETLSRVSEAITNGCIRTKSSYYGRTDSEPFSFSTDGCGALRSLTSGLKIRRAVEDKFFASLKDLVEGLNAIDNIGYEVIEDSTLPGGYLLVIEDLDYFYRDEEILRHDYVPDGNIEIEEAKHYSRIDIGYKKWEVESVNGLAEFNSTRQYNTPFDTVNTPIDLTSVLVSGSLPIEITRQQAFSTSGATDTKYDNETFIICMRRTYYPYGTLEVEQGNIEDDENIFSPQTLYNYRISPVRNMMRWYRTIAAGFTSLFSTVNKLFFSSGTGNLVAKGKMQDLACRLESTAIRENDNVFVTQFASASDYTPLWRNETVSYPYPMSINDYFTLKAKPYGYISVQKGTGEFVKYWVKEIKYKLAKGQAEFVLREKYTQ